MLNLMLPRDVLTWALEFKKHLSLPVLIIKCMVYIKENNVTLEQLTKQREQRNYDTTREYDGEGKGKHIDTM